MDVTLGLVDGLFNLLLGSILHAFPAEVNSQVPLRLFADGTQEEVAVGSTVITSNNI